MSPKIHSAMVAIMRKVDPIAKDRVTEERSRYKYRGIDEIYNNLQDIVSSEGVYCVPKVLKNEYFMRETKSGGQMVHRTVEMEFSFYHEDGSSVVVGPLLGEAMDSGDKSANKSMSVAQKYCFIQVFLIPTKEIKDTESSAHEELGTNVNQRFGAPQQQQQRRQLDARGTLPPINEKLALNVSCETCGANLLESKSGKGYYCPNFNDRSNGEHTRITKARYHEMTMGEPQMEWSDA